MPEAAKIIISEENNKPSKLSLKIMEKDFDVSETLDNKRCF
jgi:hypothetical protein